MRRSVAIAASLAFLISASVAAASRSVNPRDFRYQRELTGPSGRPLLIEPDAGFLGHARLDLSDVRVLDASGAQVPWRILPKAPSPESESVRMLDVGREDGVLVVLLDLGGRRRIIDRVDLQIPGSNFVGMVWVRGSDDRRTFRTLGQTVVYDLGGARHARSTAVTFRASDFRYLELRARGVPRITAASVRWQAVSRQYRSWAPRSITRNERGQTTVVTVDLGHRLPVTLIDVRSKTAVYDRPLELLGSNGGVYWQPLAWGRLFHFPGTSQEPIEVDAAARFIRLRIANSDDKPLRGISVRILAETPTLYIAAESARAPFRVFYGSRSPAIGAPRYDLARLPRSALALDLAARGFLGKEQLLVAPKQPPKSLLDRYPWLIEAALGLVAIALAAAGFVAFRSKA